MVQLETVMLAVAVLLLLSVVASKISTRLSLPALLLFLVIGMLAGSEGIGGIYFDDPLVAQSLGIIALIFILFSGGLDTPFTEVRPVLTIGVLLSTFGVLITAMLVGLFTSVLLDFSLTEGFLLGAIVASTDAAAVFSILSNQRIGLKGNTIPLLKLESGSNDPMAIFLTIGAIQLLVNPQMPIANLLLIFFQQMTIGALVGYGVGRYAGDAINRLRLQYDGLYPVFTVALVLLTYGLTAALGGSGFLAVYLVGLTLGNQNFLHKNSLSRFHDGLAWLMQIILFLTLGLLVFPSQLPPIAGSGILIAIILIFIARPVSVFIVLAFARFDIRDKLMISWVGLRGATPIMLATFPLLANIAKADAIFNIVFFIVLISVLLQGTTIVRAAFLLGVDTPPPVKPKYPFEPVSGIDLKSELVELKVSGNASIVGRQIVNLGLPMGSLIVLIGRGHEIVVPNGNTIIEEGDTLLVLADKTALEEIKSIVQSNHH